MCPVPRFHSYTSQNLVQAKPRRKVITWRLKPGFLLCLVILGYTIFSLAYSEVKLRQINREIALHEEQKKTLLLEKQQLLNEMQRVSSHGYIEKVARIELGLIYPGEKVFIRGQPGNPLPLAPANPGDIGD